MDGVVTSGTRSDQITPPIGKTGRHYQPNARRKVARNHAVLECVAQGRSYVECADVFGITPVRVRQIIERAVRQYRINSHFAGYGAQWRRSLI